MNKNNRRQNAMQRDWSWQNSRIRQKAQKSSRAVRPLFVTLFTLVIIAAIVSIVLVQRASIGPGRSSSAHPVQNTTASIVLSGTPTPGTPEVHTGVFTLSDGGPIPVPANVLKPVNIARTVLNNEIYSIYAGSLARQPETGTLAVLQENIQSGQQSLHIYQSPRQQGALTIQSLQQNLVIFIAANGSQGRFNLFTDEYQFS